MLISQIGTTVLSISTKNTMRPPTLSVSMPSGKRNSEPVRIGVAASRPNSVSFRPRLALIGIPIMENMTHTAKHTVNAIVLKERTETCFWVWVAIGGPLPRYRDLFI